MLIVPVVVAVSAVGAAAPTAFASSKKPHCKKGYELNKHNKCVKKPTKKPSAPSQTRLY
jgi:hypothetical protein